MSKEPVILKSSEPHRVAYNEKTGKAVQPSHVEARPVGGDSGPDSPNVLKLHAEHSPAVEPPSSTFVHVVASEVAAGGASAVSAGDDHLLHDSTVQEPVPSPASVRALQGWPGSSEVIGDRTSEQLLAEPGRLVGSPDHAMSSAASSPAFVSGLEEVSAEAAPATEPPAAGARRVMWPEILPSVDPSTDCAAPAEAEGALAEPKVEGDPPESAVHSGVGQARQQQVAADPPSAPPGQSEPTQRPSGDASSLLLSLSAQAAARVEAERQVTAEIHRKLDEIARPANHARHPARGSR